VLLSSGDNFPHLIKKRRSQLGFVTYLLNYPRIMPQAVTWYRSAVLSVHCTKSCIYSQKVLLRMGEFVARNM